MTISGILKCIILFLYTIGYVSLVMLVSDNGSNVLGITCGSVLLLSLIIHLVLFGIKENSESENGDKSKINKMILGMFILSFINLLFFSLFIYSLTTETYNYGTVNPQSALTTILSQPVVSNSLKLMIPKLQNIRNMQLQNIPRNDLVTTQSQTPITYIDINKIITVLITFIMTILYIPMILITISNMSQ